MNKKNPSLIDIAKTILYIGLTGYGGPDIIWIILGTIFVSLILF